MTHALPSQEINEVLRNIVSMADKHSFNDTISGLTGLKLMGGPPLGSPSGRDVAFRRRRVFATAAMAAAYKIELFCPKAQIDDDVCWLTISQHHPHPCLQYPCKGNEILDYYVSGVRKLLESSIEEQQEFAREVEEKLMTKYEITPRGADASSESRTKHFREVVANPDFGVRER